MRAFPPFWGKRKDKTAWNLILVNREHPIPGGYDVELTKLSTASRSTPASIRRSSRCSTTPGRRRLPHRRVRISDGKGTETAYVGKIADYEEEGYSPPTKQKSQSPRGVAVLGTSEHQLGLCVDINADGIHSAGMRCMNGLRKTPTGTGLSSANRRTSQKSPDDPRTLALLLCGGGKPPWKYTGRGSAFEEYIETLE